MPFDFQLTDDQVALLGCFIAVAASMVLMSLSFHGNPENKGETGPDIRTLPMPTAKREQKKAA